MIRSSLAVALAASAALLFASPALAEEPDGIARYGYSVTGVDFDASADLMGARDPANGDCVANVTAGWAGHVTSVADNPELSALTFGKGSLKIGNQGTTGKVVGEIPLLNGLEDGFHLLETVCDDPSTTEVDEGEQEVTPCSESGVESDLTVSAKVRGGVGDRVKLTWKFEQGEGAGFLVLNDFRCVEVFEFGESPTCTTNAKLNAFTSKKVTLPFTCLYQTLSPPPGTTYTSYTAYSFADGAVHMKRTKQSLTKR
jgi:hypothetical protein